MKVGAAVREFLSSRRIAFVGISPDERDFSRAVWRAFRRAGYELEAIGPASAQLGGRPCYPRLTAMPRPVDAAFVMVPARAAYDVVRECVLLDIPRLWLHRGVGFDSASPTALALAESSGIRVVHGECPMAYLGEHPAFRQANSSDRRVAV